MQCDVVHNYLAGLPLQPYYSALTPLLDRYSANLPEHVAPVVLSQTHIIPSTRYISGEYPAVLVERLMSMVPPPAAPTERSEPAISYNHLPERINQA